MAVATGSLGSLKAAGKSEGTTYFRIVTTSTNKLTGCKEEEEFYVSSAGSSQNLRSVQQSLLRSVQDKLVAKSKWPEPTKSEIITRREQSRHLGFTDGTRGYQEEHLIRVNREVAAIKSLDSNTEERRTEERNATAASAVQIKEQLSRSDSLISKELQHIGSSAFGAEKVDATDEADYKMDEFSSTSLQVRTEVLVEVDNQLNQTDTRPIIKKLILNPAFLRNNVQKLTLVPTLAGDDQSESSVRSIKLIQSEERHKCSSCQQIFYTVNDLRKHRYTHREKVNNCDVCSKSFHAPSSLKIHKQTHTTEKNYHCEECGLCLKTEKTFQKHVLLHGERCYFKCQQCDKRFSSKKSLNEHVDTCHKNITHNCKLCPKRFRQAQTLKTHMLKHDPKHQTTLYKCSECDAEFLGHLNRKVHMRRQHSGKKYVCDICGKEITAMAGLKDHMKIHTGEKSFVCETCGKGFYKKMTLVAHIRVHTKEKPYPCKVCGKGFSQLGSVKVHMNSVHKSTKTHVCHICGKAFKTQSLLKTHCRSHGIPLSHI